MEIIKKNANKHEMQNQINNIKCSKNKMNEKNKRDKIKRKYECKGCKQ